MLDQVATISTNNDPELGKIIGDAFRVSRSNTGVVVMEPSADGKTSVEIVDGVQYNKGLANSHFRDKPVKQKQLNLENPLSFTYRISG